MRASSKQWLHDHKWTIVTIYVILMLTVSTVLQILDSLGKI